MTDISLQTGLRALLTARYSLDTIGHNLANANTPGYSRQRLQVGTAAPFLQSGILVGNGVQAESVQRSVDELLNRRIYAQRGVGGGLEAQLGLLSEVEALLGEPGQSGIAARLDSYFTSLSELSTAPSDGVLRSAAVRSIEGLTGQFRQLSHDLGRTGEDVLGTARARADEVNDAAASILRLNRSIVESESHGVTANDLRDERDRLVGELSERIDVQTVEEQDGTLRVLVAGNTLVGRSRVNELSADVDPNGQLVLRIEGANGNVPAKSGALGGLLQFRGEIVDGLGRDLDRLARELILQTNRVHSTGLSSAGPFDRLTGTYALEDRDGDGDFRDELLSNAGLPFDVTSGTLDVNVTDPDGGVRKTRISISSTHTTVGDFLDQLDAIEGLNAEVDSFGLVRVLADPGYGFDFSRRVDPDPDDFGTLGGAAASLGSGVGGPFVLADGDTLDFTVDSGGGPIAVQITLDAADFGEISQASASELAAVVNADPAAQAAGLRAVVDGDQVFFQTLAEGEDTALTFDGGSAAGALGLGAAVGQTFAGSLSAVDVAISGTYTGSEDATFRFQPRSDGTVGTTPDLVVDVYDGNGRLVTSLEVGEGYVPGEELVLGDGLSVRFGLGELSASANDAVGFRAVVDSDTSDVLVALGLNALFTGTDASDIDVRADLLDDPGLLATSVEGGGSDNALLLELLDLEQLGMDGLDGRSLGEFYGGIVSDLGFEVSVSTEAYQANDTLVQSLQQRRDAVAGVNVDEELVDLVRYEQAFSAAAQFISVVNQLGEEVLSLI